MAPTTAPDFASPGYRSGNRTLDRTRIGRGDSRNQYGDAFSAAFRSDRVMKSSS
jgi:hypothetical protein